MAGFMLPFMAGAAGSMLPSLLGKKSKTPGPIDVSGLRQLITQSAERQRRTLSGVRPELTQRTQQFGADIESKLESLTAERKAGSEQYLSELDKNQAAIGGNLYNTLQESRCQPKKRM